MRRAQRRGRQLTEENEDLARDLAHEERRARALNVALAFGALALVGFNVWRCLM